MSNIVPVMSSFFVKGLGCPGINLAQKKVAEDFLGCCANDLGLDVSAEPFSKVCEPSYPGHNGIAANLLLTVSYITVATFVRAGEVWVYFAPLPEEQQRYVFLGLTLRILRIFGAKFFQADFGSISPEQLIQNRFRLIGMRRS